MKNTVFLCFLNSLLWVQTALFAGTSLPQKTDDPVLAALDSLQYSKFFESTTFCDDTASLNIHGYCPDLVPLFRDDEYAARLALLDEQSPFDLVFNEHVKKYIEVYAVKKRKVVSRVLGLSHLYFPLFEGYLDRHGLPHELKYLAIVESALNPVAVSRSGAGGLWQFILSTGKMYGLEVNSYVDERRDPHLATEAACKYMKYLYGMFGDWQMVLAAYNCGPGALSRAIRRSGGKKTYWELRPWLPEETQNYVPAFIAVNYVMNHAAAHNLYPIAPKKHYFFADTLVVRDRIDLRVTAQTLGIPYEDVCFLNPAYNMGVIPRSESGYTLCLPPLSTGVFLQNQREIQAASRNTVSPLAMQVAAKAASNKTWVKVKKGQSLTSIARANGCTPAELKKWNHVKSNHVAPGKVLVVMERPLPAGSPVAEVPTNASQTLSMASSDSLNTKTDSLQVLGPFTHTKVRFHTVQKGDTLWSIASRYKGTTVEEIIKANRLEHSRLSVGTTLKIPVKS